MTKRLLACLLAFSILLSSGLVSAQPSSSPSKEEKESMLTFSIGSALMKVEVCDADIIHVRYSPSGTFEEKDLNTFTVENNWDYSDYEVVEANGVLTVTTAKLKVTIDKATGKVTYYDAAGQVVLAERNRTDKAIKLDDNQPSYEVAQEFVSDDNEALYGFGNINNTMGIKNQSVKIAQTNTEKRTPMFYSNMGYGILFDITSNGQLDWLDGGKVYRYTGKASDSMDYYFFYGPEADTVISGYRTVTGKATMLPKNAFGYVQSRNRYGSQKEVQDVLDTFREKQIPLDVLIIDYYWWQGNFNNITQWNTANWPNPASMMDYLHRNNVSASISVWPTFQAGTPTYDTLHNAGFLMPTNSGFGYTYDPTSQAARDMYWGMINDNVFSKGLDSLWLDADEPENSNWARDNASEPTAWGNSKPIGALYPLLTNRGVYEGQRAIAGNEKRVNTLSRGAVAGVQRYGAQSWSGDIASTWDQLNKEISGVINYSAAGLPYFCTDTGGYFGFNSSDPDGREMFFRWLQFSTFNTVMRVHGAGNVREPWQFGSVYEGYITDFIKLRERLVPYIYSLAGATTQNDYTPVRPLIFDFRTDDNVKNIKDQYMFGPSLMVCPVSTAGQRSRSVYLPAGTWINYWTGESIVSAGETITAAAPLKQIPLFVRAGSVIPMGPENQYVDESQDPTEIRVYMGADGSFNLYEDEGNNYNYENGKFSNIPFTYNEASKTVTIGKREGSFDGMLTNRTFKVVFVQPGYGIGGSISSDYQPSAVVAYDGSEATVTFDPNWAIPTPPLDTETLPSPEVSPAPKASDRAMVGYWPFREGEGAKVSDDSGCFNNGGLNLSHWTAEGKVGNAIQFSGGTADTEGTFVQVPDSTSLDLSTGISFSAWIKNDSTTHANIVNKGGNSTNNPGYSFILLGGTGLQLEIQSDLANGKTQKTTAKSTIPVNRDGQWHQVGFTWKSEADGGDGIVRIFIDGKQTSDDSNASNYFAGPIGQNNYPLVLGRSCENEPHSPNYFKGTMDEPRLFNYALDKDDMTALFNGKEVVVPNVTDVSVTPGDGKLTINWTDMDSTESVKVRVETVDPDFSETPIDKTLTIEKGKQTLTVDGLVNGEYYYVTVVSVDSSGKESQGVCNVARPAPYPVDIDPDCVVTHGNQVYAWMTNNGSAPVNGTLTITLKEGNTVKDTLTQDVSLAGNDRLQYAGEFQVDYAAGQTMTFSLKNGDTLLAAEVTMARAPYYVEKPVVDKSALQVQLKVIINESLYTEETLTPYKAAYKAAQIVNRNSKATQEEVNDALAALKEAKKNLKRKSTEGIVMTFSQSEGTTSRLLYGNMFYIDWKSADGVPFATEAGPGVNLSGSAANGANPDMHFKATVVFNTTDGKTDPASVWKDLRFRLRSSHIDNDEKGGDFYSISPSSVTTPDMFEVDIPLSEFGKGKIDWADVKDLIIQCDIADELKLPDGTGESQVVSLTLADIWIEDMGASQPADKAALKAALDTRKTGNALEGYTAASVAEYNKLFDDAQAVYDNNSATAEQIKNAILSLRNADSVLVKDETPVDPDVVAVFWDDEKTSPEDHYLSVDGSLETSLDLNPYANDELFITYQLKINTTANFPNSAPEGWLEYVRNGEARLWSVPVDQTNNDNRVTVGGDETGMIHATKGELADMRPGEWITVTQPVPQAILEAGQITKFHLYLYNDLDALNADWANDAGLTISVRNAKVIKSGSTEEADKTALNDLITTVESLDTTGYVPTLVTALEEALANARTITGQADATQAAVDEACEALQAAKDTLRKLGDLNGDGNITAEDALLALQAATNKINLTDIQKMAGNVDGKEDVTANDALLILQFVTKKITSF